MQISQNFPKGAFGDAFSAGLRPQLDLHMPGLRQVFHPGIIIISLWRHNETDSGQRTSNKAMADASATKKSGYLTGVANNPRSTSLAVKGAGKELRVQVVPEVLALDTVMPFARQATCDFELVNQSDVEEADDNWGDVLAANANIRPPNVAAPSASEQAKPTAKAKA